MSLHRLDHRKNGEVTADIQWSSSNYDYMIVDGEKYLPVNEEGTNSEFLIPVTIMDESMPVIADTTAMVPLMRSIIPLTSIPIPSVPKARCRRKQRNVLLLLHLLLS